MFISSTVAIGLGVAYVENPLVKWPLIIFGFTLLLGGVAGIVSAIKSRSESFEGQVRDVSTLVEFSMGRGAETEIICYFEKRQNGLDPLGHMMVMTELAKDPLIVLAHGMGSGHAFVRSTLLREVTITRSKPFENYAELVRECRKRGYKVKRFPFYHATIEN